MVFFDERELTEQIYYRREVKWFDDIFNQLNDSRTKLTERNKELAKIFKM